MQGSLAGPRKIQRSGRATAQEKGAFFLRARKAEECKFTISWQHGENIHGIYRCVYCGFEWNFCTY